MVEKQKHKPEEMSDLLPEIRETSAYPESDSKGGRDRDGSQDFCPPRPDTAELENPTDQSARDAQERALANTQASLEKIEKGLARLDHFELQLVRAIFIYELKNGILATSPAGNEFVVPTLDEVSDLIAAYLDKSPDHQDLVRVPVVGGVIRLLYEQAAHIFDEDDDPETMFIGKHVHVFVSFYVNQVTGMIDRFKEEKAAAYSLEPGVSQIARRTVANQKKSKVW